MKRIAILAALMAGPVQDASEVQKQAARVSESDPTTSFDAISRLVDLAATSKAEVEAAAAKLPAFYKEALLEELKAREKLGAKFGKEIRVSLDLKEKSVSEAITELTEASKEKVDTTWAFRDQAQPTTQVTLKLEDVTFLRALDAICKEPKLWIYGAEEGVAVYQNGGMIHGTSIYRHFLLQVSSAEKQRRTEFGGKTKHTLTLRVSGVWDSKAGTIHGRDLRLVEAVDDKGRTLQAMPREEGERDLYEVDESVDNGVNVGFDGELRFKLPEKDAEKIARVRGSVAFLVPVKTATLTLACKEGKPEPVSDDFVEFSIVELPGQVEQRGGFQRFNSEEVKVRVKPKGDLEALKKTPLAFTMKVKDQEAYRASVYGRVVDGALEYTLYPMMRGQQFGGGDAMNYESITIHAHRECVERRVSFEFRDLPLKEKEK